LPTGARSVCADWRTMPVDDASIDLVAGDGCYSTLPFPSEYRALDAELRRVLRPNGRIVMRVFASPSMRESVDAVAADLWARRIESFHVFKWRLAMALQPSAEAGVRLGDIWTAWRSMCPEPATLTEKLGWPTEIVATIDAYRGADATYTFPTLAELRAVLAESFVELACVTPAYQLGARCPTLVLTAR